MKMALLVIDLQKAYYHGADAASMDSAAEYINAILPLFRGRGLPIAWIQHIDEGDGAIEGQSGFDFIDALAPLSGEARISKRYGNAFNKTGLADLLAEERVDTVVVTGYCAEYCVLSTCRGAKDLDLAPVILRGAIASGNAENLAFVERVNDLVSYRFLAKLLKA
jgi:nicotinamidase-related amidase